MHDVDPEVVNAETRPEMGFEARDISVGPIVKAATWFFTIATVFIFVTIPIFCAMGNSLGGFSKDRDPKLVVPKDPNPLLQTNRTTKTDIRDLRRSEDRQLNSYGWVDEAKGVAHIPVDRAIEIASGKGLGGAR